VKPPIQMPGKLFQDERGNLVRKTADLQFRDDPIKVPQPSMDDPKWYQLGLHFNIWTLGGIVVVAFIICYCTGTWPFVTEASGLKF